MRVLCSLVAAAVVCAPRAVATEPRWPGLYLPNPIGQYAVHWALAGAADWLKKPECRKVFTDFTDQDGVRLDLKLGRFATDEVAYLATVLFRDGSRLPPCSRPATVMFTTPGSKVVFVCEKQFLTLVKTDRPRLSALVIHEALHTLGLGENPPTTKQITDQVMTRCWR